MVRSGTSPALRATPPNLGGELDEIVCSVIVYSLLLELHG